MSKEEDLLIKRLKAESTRRAAFEEMVKRYSPTLYHQIRRIVTWHDDADDVLQNTFLKAWGGLDNFRGDSSLSTWLYRIAYNESVTFLSKNKENHNLIDSDQDEVRQLESDPYFDGNEVSLHLEKVLLTLPAKQRAVFHLKYFEDKKYEEISAILNTSVGALKASYHHAVKKIEKYFNELE